MKNPLANSIRFGVPIFLILMLPTFGVGLGITLSVLFILVFGVHLFMRREYIDHMAGTDAEAPPALVSKRGN